MRCYSFSPEYRTQYPRNLKAVPALLMLAWFVIIGVGRGEDVSLLRPAASHSARYASLTSAAADASADNGVLLADSPGLWPGWIPAPNQSLRDSAVVANFDPHVERPTRDGVDGMPAQVVFDASGNIVFAHGGYMPADALGMFDPPQHGAMS